MSEESSEDRGRDAESTVQPGTPNPAKLRRGVFGYRRADVDQALDARESELAELHQDVAALWLAFAQHDRMIREGITIERPPPTGFEQRAEPPRPRAAPQPEPSVAAVESTESVASQLSDLDEVLAAIEMATQALEQTYTEEIAGEQNEPVGTSEPEITPESVERD